MEDAIIISGLELQARVGVTIEERARVQRVTVSLGIFPKGGVSGVGDEIGRTVDYAAVREVVKREVESKERKLAETIAEDVARVVLEGFELVEAVEVEVQKYVLADTEWVGVRVMRLRKL
jgi:dihydroneopterin aldolase